MGRLIAIEGRDGAGKGTLTHALKEVLEAEGYKVGTVSFPRYGDTLAGDTLGRFLNGTLRAPQDPRVIASLYALDRFESMRLIRRELEDHDFLISDRYTASNVAYQSAKCPVAERGAMSAWIRRLELETYELPRPALNVLLTTPMELARRNVERKRPRDYTDATLDVHEADGTLQHSVQEVYESLASSETLGSWLTVRTDTDGRMRAPSDIAREVATYLFANPSR